MPINLKTINNEPADVGLTYGGEAVQVTYNRNGINNREWRRLGREFGEANPTNADSDWRIEVLSRLIVKWDVVHQNGKGKEEPYPTTKEALDELPPRFLSAVLEAILEDALPKETPEATGGSFG